MGVAGSGLYPSMAQNIRRMAVAEMWYADASAAYKRTECICFQLAENAPTLPLSITTHELRK